MVLIKLLKSLEIKNLLFGFFQNPLLWNILSELFNQFQHFIAGF